MDSEPLKAHSLKFDAKYTNSMHVSTYFSVDGKKRYEEAISISPNLSQEAHSAFGV